MLRASPCIVALYHRCLYCREEAESVSQVNVMLFKYNSPIALVKCMVV